MNRISILFLILIITITSCSSDFEELCSDLNSDRISSDLAIARFTSFSVFGTDAVHINLNDQQSISVNAHETAIPKISLTVTDYHWEMENTSCEGHQLDNVFTLQLDDLNSIGSFGDSEIGCSNIMVLKNLNIKASDNSLITLTGKVQTLILDVTGNAELNLNNFQAQNITINASGNSRTKIYATNSIEAIVKDHAEVIYQGGPRINSQVSDQGVLKEK